MNGQLRSPNGLGAGGFFIQHRLQLGWKYILKARVFESEIDFPYVLFYVSELVPQTGPIDKIEQELDNAVSTTRRKRALSKVGNIQATGFT